MASTHLGYLEALEKQVGSTSMTEEARDRIVSDLTIPNLALVCIGCLLDGTMGGSLTGWTLEAGGEDSNT